MDRVMMNEIEQLNKRPINEDLIFYVTLQAYSVVPRYRCENSSQSSLFSASDKLYSQLPPLSSFITLVINRSRVKAGTLLGSLVFLSNMSKSLPATSKGMPCTPYRIFLASLIISSKAFNDISPKNSFWCRQAIYFTLSEINLMEKQLLRLLDYNIWVKPKELLNVYRNYNLFDLNLLIRQASCVSALQQRYVEPPSIYASGSSNNSMGYSDDTLIESDFPQEEYLKCDPLYSLKNLPGTCEMGNENMITIIDNNYNMEIISNLNQQ